MIKLTTQKLLDNNLEKIFEFHNHLQNVGIIYNEKMLDFDTFLSSVSSKLKCNIDGNDRLSLFLEIFRLSSESIRIGPGKFRGIYREFMLGIFIGSEYMYVCRNGNCYISGVVDMRTREVRPIVSESMFDCISRCVRWLETGEIIREESMVCSETKYPSPAEQEEEMEEGIIKAFSQLCVKPDERTRAQLELLLMSSYGFWTKSKVGKVIAGIAGILNLGINKSIFEICIERGYWFISSYLNNYELLGVLENPNIELMSAVRRAMSYLIIPFISEVNLNMFGVDLVSIEAARSVDGMDFLSSVSEIFKNVNRIIDDYKTSGNLTCLFSSDSLYDQWMNKYWKLYSDIEKSRQNPQPVATNRKLIERATQMLNDGNKIKSIIPERVARLQLQRAMYTLSSLSSDFMARITQGNQRRKAFALSVGGDSQIGKTAISTILFRIIHRGLGTDFNPANRVTLTGCEKYFQNVTNYTSDIQIDDIENEINTESSSYIVRIINNVVFDLEQAEAHMKGKCKPAPEVVILNTNVFTLNAEKKTYSIPSAWNRMLHLFVELKPEYRNESNTLDGKALSAFIDDEELPECWTFTLYNNVVVPRSEPYPVKDCPSKPILHKDQNCYLRPVIDPHDRVTPLQNVDFKTLSKALIKLAENHKLSEDRIEEVKDFTYIERVIDSLEKEISVEGKELPIDINSEKASETESMLDMGSEVSEEDDLTNTSIIPQLEPEGESFGNSFGSHVSSLNFSQSHTEKESVKARRRHRR